MTPIDNHITYPDAHMILQPDGQWKLVPARGTVSFHKTRDDAYEALKEIRENSCNGEEGCLMCSG